MRRTASVVFLFSLLFGTFAFAEHGASVTCGTRDNVRAWIDSLPVYASVKDTEPISNLRNLAREAEDQLTALCVQGESSQPDWLKLADQASLKLFQLAANIRAARSVREISADMLSVAMAYNKHLNSLRSEAYDTVRTEIKEVVREVPAECPQVREPERPDPCLAALRQSAKRWSGQLYAWTDRYHGSGADWQLAKSSAPELAGLSNGSGDPVSYITGWLAQWRYIRRKNDTSFFGSGPMPQVAADMRAQLALCGYPQPDWDHEDRRR